MQRALLIITLLCTTISFSQAQIFVGNDTALCTDSFTLRANVVGSYSTDSYVFNSIPFSPVPIGGNTITLFDDDVSAALPIGFDFCFLGNTYNQFYFGSNGWISFDPGQPTTYTSATIPSTDASVPKNCIMGPWEDWHPGLCVGNCLYYETIGTAPNRMLVVSWVAVPMFSCTDSFGTFQVVLHETTNLIENHLIDKPNCLQWANGTGTQGVHDQTGTVAFTVPGRNSTQWNVSSESVEFRPNGITWFDLNSNLLGYGDSLTVGLGTGGGTYYAEITLCDGTTYRDTMTVTSSDAMVSANSMTDPLCHGEANGDVDVIASGTTGPYTYSIDGGANFQNNGVFGSLGAGSHTVIVEDTAGCRVSYTFNLANPTQITSTTSVVDNCWSQNQGEATANGMGGTGNLSYSWNDNNNQTTSTATGLENGTFVVTITDDNNCSTTDTAVIIGLNYPSVDPFLAGVCPGESIDLTASINEIGTFTWNGGSLNNVNGPSVQVTPAGTTDYEVNWNDGTCDTTLFVHIDVIDLEVNDISNDTTIFQGQSAILYASGNYPNDQISYSWQPMLDLDDANSQSPTATPSNTTTYIVEVTHDGAGCTAYDTVTVVVDPEPENLYAIPDAFTPNGDNNNEVFEVLINAGVTVKEFKIFNRWGEIIYDNPEGKWDGRYKGEEQPVDTYLYHVVLDNPYAGDEIIHSGPISLLR